MQNLGEGFNVFSAKEFGIAMNIISNIDINCIVINYDMYGEDVINFIKKVKNIKPSISRIVIVENEITHNETEVALADIMFALPIPYENAYLQEAIKMACLANGSDKRALFFSVTETVANKLENLNLKGQFKAQELMLRQYVDKVLEAKTKEIKSKEVALKAKASRFKAVRLSWKATVILRTLLFTAVSGIIGAYKSELTQSFIDLIHLFDD